MVRLHSTYRLIAIFMAVLMLSSSMGLSMDLHYCQGQLKSLSFFGEAKSCYQLTNADSKQRCAKDRDEKVVERYNGCSLVKKDCCENRSYQLLFEQESQLQSSQYTLSQQLQTFITSFVVVFIQESIVVDTLPKDGLSYKPPLIPMDIYVLLEAFLL